MKIAVNTRLLLKDKLEGIGWFSYESLKRICIAHPEHEFVFIFDRPYSEEFIFADNVTPVVVGPPARHPFLYILWFEISVAKVLRKHNVDVFLSTDGYLSLSTKVPSIAVLHDLNLKINLMLLFSILYLVLVSVIEFNQRRQAPVYPILYLVMVFSYLKMTVSERTKVWVGMLMIYVSLVLTINYMKV